MTRPTPGGLPTAALAAACTAVLAVITAAGIVVGVRVLDAGLFILSCLLNALP